MRIKLLLIISSFALSARGLSQNIDSSVTTLVKFPTQYVHDIEQKANGLEASLDRSLKKYLVKFQKHEGRVKRYIGALDTLALKTLFSREIDQQYSALINRVRAGNIANSLRTSIGAYFPNIDTLQGSLSFLSKNSTILNGSGILPEDVMKSLKSLQLLQGKLDEAEQVKQFLQQRKEQIRSYLSGFTHLPSQLEKQYKSYAKELYYYGEQIKQYKESLNDPDKVERMAISLLGRVPAFAKFMKSNSILANAFSGSSDAVPGAGSGPGLANRDAVLAAFQPAGAGGSTHFRDFAKNSINNAQGNLSQMREKIPFFGGADGANLDMPEYRPNNQRVKSFLKRIELGTNLQTVRSSMFFPATADLAVSVGYRINDHNVIGIGGSYKVGLGENISHIHMTSQGASIRSFVDLKIWKDIFISGGFEYNYQKPFGSIRVFQELQSWQQSGLIGLSKIVSLNKGIIKKTKIQLLWDFLSYRQVPQAQPIKVRIGYSF